MHRAKKRKWIKQPTATKVTQQKWNKSQEDAERKTEN